VHEERAARYLPDPHITAADPEFSFNEAHGLRSITASATLVKHERSVLFPQLVDDFFRSGCDQYSFDHEVFFKIKLKNPIDFILTVA
jgi:hypothetical protein